MDQEERFAVLLEAVTAIHNTLVRRGILLHYTSAGRVANLLRSLRANTEANTDVLDQPRNCQEPNKFMGD